MTVIKAEFFPFLLLFFDQILIIFFFDETYEILFVRCVLV